MRFFLFIIITFILTNISAQNTIPFTKVDVSVNSMGAAVANVAIECPTGRNGIKPELSIGFNSNVQKGALGQNFSLNGLSAITRGGRNYHLDNKVQEGVLNTDDDNFYLDGNKLILVSGTRGTSGCIYRTENDLFAMVTYLVSGGVGYFTAQPKNGGLLLYQSPQYLKNVTGGGYANVPFSYCLTRSYDFDGNYIEYEYDNSEPAELNIATIKYNGFDCSYGGHRTTSCSYATIAPNMFVKFTYAGGLSDVKFVNGKQALQTKRLDAINVTLNTPAGMSGSVQTKQYAFDYCFKYGFNEGGYYLNAGLNLFLKSITEDAKPPVNIIWQDNEADARVSGSLWSPEYNFKKVGDFDGDGKSDLLLIDAEINPLNNKLGDRSMRFNILNTTQNGNFTTTTGGTYTLQSLFGYHLPYDNVADISVVDYDADGDDDLIFQVLTPTFYVNSVTATYTYHLYKTELKTNSAGKVVFDKFTAIKNIFAGGSYTVYYSGTYPDYKSHYVNAYYTDLDGDGLVDLVEKVTNSLTDVCTIQATLSTDNFATTRVYTLNGNTTHNIKSFMLMDFDGNGKKDFFVYQDGYSNIIKYNLTTKNFDTYYQVLVYNTTYGNFHTGDFNGDGNADILYYRIETTGHIRGIIGYSNGNNAFIEHYFPSVGIIGQLCYSCTFDNISIEVADFNGDGRDDVLERNDQSVIDPVYGAATYNSYFIHYGAGYLSFVNGPSATNRIVTVNTNKFGRSILGDFDGNGTKDVLMFEKEQKNYVIEYHRTFKLTVKEIQEAKRKHEFTYTPLNKFNGFTKTLTPTINNSVSLSVPLKVVSNYKVSTLLSPTVEYYYNYKDLIYNRHGKGFMGFMEIKQRRLIDNTNSVVNVRKFEQNMYVNYQLNIAKESNYNQSTLLDGLIQPTDLVSETQFEHQTIYPVTGNNAINFTFISTRQETDNLTQNVKKSCYDFDNYGNLTYQGTIFYTLSNAAVQHSNASVYTYEQFATWVPSSLTIEKNYKTRTGKPTIVTPITYTYWTNTNKVKNKVTLNGTSANQITEVFEYDKFGNTTKKGFDHSLNIGGSSIRNTFTVYDADGRFIDYTMNDLGHKTYYEFDPKLEVLTKLTAANGLETNYEYDTYGRLTKTTLPNGNYMDKSYALDLMDDNSLFVVTETNNLGEMNKQYYNWNSQLVKEEKKPKLNTTSPYLALKLYTYYNNGLLKSETNWHNPGVVATKIPTTYEYDGYNRPTLVKTNTIQLKQYSYSQNVVTFTEASRAAKVSTFDAIGLPVSVAEGGNQINYDYNSNGQALTITTNGNVVSFTYSDNGLITGKCTPNGGCQEMQYNPFGEIIHMTDAKGNSYNFEYDSQGKPIKKSGPNNAEYLLEYYDVNLQADLNLPKTFTYKENGTVKHQLNYAYNSLADLTETGELAANSNTYTTSYTYDALHRLNTINYPNILVKYEYDDNNTLLYIKNDKDEYLWSNDEELPDGRPVSNTFGNGYQNEFTYDNNLSLATIKSHVGSSPNVTFATDLQYTFDLATQNLVSKSFMKSGYTETYHYDNLDRLDNISIVKIGETTQNLPVNYATNGNITQKYDAGTYTYSSTKPHAVIANTFPESTMPNTIPYAFGDDQTITYTPFNKIATLQQGSKNLSISYGFDQERLHTLIEDNSETVKEIFYIRSANMEIVNGDEVTYLEANGQAFAFHKSSTGRLNYLHLDYQGSVVSITDEDGALVDERNYDVWGRPRSVNTLEYVLPNPFGSGSPITRGYTFQEHLEEFNLINMNGRMYDPIQARFLSEDPLIQDASNAQNFNAYSYVLNNPTKYTDPSGYAFTGGGGASNNSGPNNIYDPNNDWKKEFNDGSGNKETVIFKGMAINVGGRRKVGGGGGGSYIINGEPRSYLADRDYGKVIGSTVQSGMGGTLNSMSSYTMATYGVGQSNVSSSSNSSYSSISSLGTAFSIVDFFVGAYNEYVHNHTTYTTTKGIEKNIFKPNGEIRSLRAGRFANISRFVKGLSFVGSVASTLYTGNEILDALQEGQNISGWKYADFSVGVAGTASSAILMTTLVTNPVGLAALGVIGTGALLYGGARLGYELFFTE
ncbi:MAG: RHS repeat-associated core domain-containing protein [Bacteroidota bacterium]